MLLHKSPLKRKTTVRCNPSDPLDRSLTSIDWLRTIQIGEHSPSLALIANDAVSLPMPVPIVNQHEKIEPEEVELFQTSSHLKPPYSYVVLIRQAILSNRKQRMTLNEIYQWIIDTYPYFRTAPAKWKNSIRHNLSLNKCFKRLQRGSNDPGKGSYWAVVDSNRPPLPMSLSRKRKFDDDWPSSVNILSTSPESLHPTSTIFCSNNNPMICDLTNSSGQSNSARPFSSLTNCDDDLTCPSRRYHDTIFDLPTTNWLPPTSSGSPTRRDSWSSDLITHDDTHHSLENVQLPSSNDSHWSNLPSDDRSKIFALGSSFSSIFDFPSNTPLTQAKISNDLNGSNRFLMTSYRSLTDANNHFTPLPVIVDDDAFDWESLI